MQQTGRGEKEREEGCTDDTKTAVNNTGFDLWLNLIHGASLQCYLKTDNMTVLA